MITILRISDLHREPRNPIRNDALLILCSPAFAQDTDPHKLLAEADRLAWLRVWTRAEPLYAQAREAFVRSGDKRNALGSAFGGAAGFISTAYRSSIT